MPINREPESVDDHAHEESAVRRTPLDQDDTYELADHEFTLVAEDAGDDSRGWPYDEHTAPWSTLPPLPAWATNARAILEPPTLPRPLNDETPTLVEEGDHASATALRALRTEIGQLLRDADARGEQIDQLERSLASAVQARAEAELRNGNQAESAARAQGHAARILELEEEVSGLRNTRDARTVELEEELKALESARDAKTAELEDELRQLKKQHAARTAELEEEVRELQAVHEVRAAALEELRALNATQEARVAELERERREVKSARKARSSELEELRTLTATQATQITTRDRELQELNTAQAARAAELDELRSSKAAQAARATRVAEFEHQLRSRNAAQLARVSELEHELNERTAGQGTHSAELDELRSRDAAQAARVAELEHELKARDAAQGTHSAELDELRSRDAAQAARVAELEHELRVLRAVFQDEHARQFEIANGVPSESEADIETTVAWITNAPPGLEVTIEVDSNDDVEDFAADATASAETAADVASIGATVPLAAVVRNLAAAAAATQGRRRAHAHDREATTVAIAALDVPPHIDADASDETTTFGARAGNEPAPVFDPNDHAESHESVNAGDSETTTIVDRDLDMSPAARDCETTDITSGVDAAPAARDSDVTTEFELIKTVARPPSPETTLEIDPDSDLFELDAILPPLSTDAPPSAASGKRNARKERKPRKPPTKQRSVPRDDLQQIDGIGKRIEQRLHAKGVRTYAQLAALRAPDLARVAKQIGVTPERIAREAWIPQARRLKKHVAKRPPAAPAKLRKPKRASA